MSGTSTAAEYDLLIVGGGLVGASLAAALAPLPLRIAVVEAVAFGNLNQPSFDDRITAVSYGSRRIFESMGLWSRLAAEVNPIRHIHVSDRGRFGVTRLDAEEARVDALGYVVPNRAIGRALSEFIAAQKNIEMLAPAKLESFTLGESGIEAVIEASGKRSLKAKLLVAADGARSEVRSKLGISGETVDYAQTAIVCNVRVEHPQAETAFERFADDGPVALLPMGGDRYGFVWVAATADAPALLGLDDETFRAQAAERFNGRLGRFTESGKRVSYPLSMVRASAQVQGRALIIGNAAHSLHPIAGQGFNLSLRDVAMLAEVLSDARRDGEDLGSSSVLARYVEGRSGDQQGTAVFTDLLNRVFANPLMSVALGRNMGLLALELMPPARRALMRKNMGLDGWQPKLARGLPLR